MNWLQKSTDFLYLLPFKIVLAKVMQFNSRLFTLNTEQWQ